jgi:hypothetical protein
MKPEQESPLTPTQHHMEFYPTPNDPNVAQSISGKRYGLYTAQELKAKLEAEGHAPTKPVIGLRTRTIRSDDGESVRHDWIFNSPYYLLIWNQDRKSHLIEEVWSLREYTLEQLKLEFPKLLSTVSAAVA